MRFILHGLLLAASLSGFTPHALAQHFPAKPVRIVIPYPPGGASDVTARLLAQKLSERWNQSVVADNRPGANGIVALEYVAKQPADGYTLLMANLGPNAINPAVYAKLPYDPIRDFTPITLTTMVPQVLVAQLELPGATLKDMIAWARTQPPGRITYGHGGNGSANHLAVELIANLAGLSFTAVPYKGDAPAMADVIGGQIQMTLPTVVAAMPQLRAGKLKALAVTTAQRVASLPDVPTVAEAGLGGYESSSWGGIMGPGAMPADLVERIHTDIAAVLTLADVRDKLGTLGAEVVSRGPAQFTAFLRDDIRKWSEVASKAKIRAD